MNFLGVFRTPFPQRMAYCDDIAALPHYDATNEHFLFSDIQFGKGKARNVKATNMPIDGKDEQVFYRIVPCGGVKYCGKRDEGCTYITSTRETRNCAAHPSTPLVRSQKCDVEFAYIWPVAAEDKRRWITGFKRTGDNAARNLHDHQVHGGTKVPSKVESDIRQAVLENPLLKTKDIMTG